MRICANTLPRIAEYARKGRVIVFEVRSKKKCGDYVVSAQDDIKLQVLGTLAGFGGTVAKIGIPILAGATSYSNFVECMKELEEQFGEVELKFKEREDACLGAFDLTTG